VQVICGLPAFLSRTPTSFARWPSRSTPGPAQSTQGLAASQAMVDYLRPLVEARREQPPATSSATSSTPRSTGEAHDSKIYGFLFRLLLPPAPETTFRVMGNCLVALLLAPGRVRAGRCRPFAHAEVIEETLRWQTSVTMVSA